MQFFRQVRRLRGPDRVEPETSRLIEAGTLLTGIIHVSQSVYWLSVHSFAACFWCLLLFMPFLLFVDAMFRNKCDLRVGLLSVIASFFTQLLDMVLGSLEVLFECLSIYILEQLI